MTPESQYKQLSTCGLQIPVFSSPFLLQVFFCSWSTAAGKALHQLLGSVGDINPQVTLGVMNEYR